MLCYSILGNNIIMLLFKKLTELCVYLHILIYLQYFIK